MKIVYGLLFPLGFWATLITGSDREAIPDARLPKRHTVEIFRMKFNPAELHVNPGDTVVWVNKDFVPHDVTEEKTRAWTSHPFGQNESWSRVITEDVDYFCNLHKVMKGTIVVE
ncbi:plastocyanin/azurin family copper-binding protein [Robiginitalea biformata]|uniref:Blue (type 1) copper domain-containing protein n=1 Tax=Robiginitalea biformata (strain ATCC BAA-864 / DSM 15991 / KCTC 12146 / HTCC2501) TaxID=313596 RepID=A4CGT9_ROBBH|nr:plastocyanin/azurin family copper-binding protein [Robiginitalea biformata]EAR16147.1 hypothetical protein RB2501_04595 [Robiginitalea biformata HTCC2501]